MESMHDVINDYSVFTCGYLLRQGFVFTAGSQSNVYDAIVIRDPADCTSRIQQRGYSQHSLEEHIEFVNTYKLERAHIIAEEFRFITRCPSLKYITVHIGDSAGDGIDLSPLYELPEIRQLNCRLTYGGNKELKSTMIDCSKIRGLRDVSIYAEGHLNYDRVDTLEILRMSENNTHRDLTDISCSSNLKSMTFLQCGLKTLHGVGQFPNLQEIHLWHQRSLEDVSELTRNAASLRALSIEACPKIKDFSFLQELSNLEHLNLEGNNNLPTLSFLNNMPKLKTFVFSMNVQDCDLMPCLRLPYASVLKGHREYNLRDKDLPKVRHTDPFVLK